MATSAIEDVQSLGSSYQRLCEDDLAIVYEELFDISIKWHELGLQFGIKNAELKKIAAQNLNPNQALCKMVETWLQTMDKPTWEFIVEKLRNRTIQESVLANDIERKYCVPKRSLSDSATAPRDSTPLLTNNSSTSYPQPPYRSPAGAASLPLVPRQQFGSPPIIHHLAQQTSDLQLDTSSTDSCTEVGETTQPPKLPFPFLDVKHLNDREKDRLIIRLRREYEVIASEYVQLRTDVKNSLINREKTVEELAVLLMDYPATRTHENPKLFEHRSDELCNAPNINRVFIILKDYNSFFYYKIIAYIVKNLGTDEDKRKIYDYECKLAEYCKRSVFECPACEYSTAPPNLVMKVDQRLELLYTMESIRGFQEDVERILNIKELQLCTVEKGCLKLRYNIPLFMQDMVFPLSSEQEGMLQGIGVIGLTCEKYKFGRQQELSGTSEQQQQSTASIDQPIKIMSTDQKQDNNSNNQFSAKPDPSLSGHPASSVPHLVSKKPEKYTSAGGKPRQKVFGDRQQLQSQKKRGTCLTYLLLHGNCEFGDECYHKHDRYLPNPVREYVPLPHQNFPPPIGKKGHSPARKGFIVFESDRSPTKEVTVVAEDAETVAYAREVIFKTQPPRSPSCTKYLLLGHCPFGEKCRYKHNRRIPNPSVGYVRHPVGRLPDGKRAVGFSGQTPSRKYYRTVQSDRDPSKEVKIVAEDDETLEYAKKDVLENLNKSHAVHDTYFIRCFIHPEAVDTTNLALKLQTVIPESSPGPRTKYVAVWDKTAVLKTEEVTVESLSHLNPEETSSVYELLENPEQTRNQQTSQLCSAHVRISRAYIVQIEKQLMDALRWIHSKHFQPKLEGRFGKCQWTKLVRTSILDDDVISLSHFIRFLFGNNEYKRHFLTKVKENSLSLLEKSCLEDSGSFVETYDVKLSVLNKGKLDLRIKFTDGKPEVVSVKVDEQKVATFDILCLHRQHDLRCSLNRYEQLPSTDPFVEKFISTLSMPQPGVLSFIPNGADKEWSLRILRHKKRRAFFCRGFDKKYVVTFTSVGDYTLPESEHIGEQITVQPSDYKEHTEAELHNLYWECAFAGTSPKSALALLIEPHAIPAEVMARAPERWTPEMIMKQFDIIQMLERLNAAMDV